MKNIFLVNIKWLSIGILLWGINSLSYSQEVTYDETEWFHYSKNNMERDYGGKGYGTNKIDSALEFSTKQTMRLYNSVKDLEERLPRSIDKNGQLLTSDDAWWCSGFTLGTLLYLYEYTSADYYFVEALMRYKKLIEHK
jgi:hypothetical protein